MGRFKIWEKISDAQSALNALSTIMKIAELKGCRECVFYIVFGAGTTAGAVQIESAHLDNFTGTWHPKGTPIAWAAANRVHEVQFTGLHASLRARISTAIVGGTVDIWFGAN